MSSVSRCRKPRRQLASGWPEGSDTLLFIYSGHGAVSRTNGHYLAVKGGLWRSELRRELCSELAGINRAQAQVVVLKDAFDFSFAEISAASGMPVGTAKCYAHRGRNGLRSRLEPADSAIA